MLNRWTGSALIVLLTMQGGYGRDRLDAFGKWETHGQEQFMEFVSELPFYDYACHAYADPDRLLEVVKTTFGENVSARDVSKLVYSVNFMSGFIHTIWNTETAEQKLKTCDKIFADYGVNGTKIQGLMYRSAREIPKE